MADSTRRLRLLIATDDCVNGGTAHLARQLACCLAASFQVTFACARRHLDPSALADLDVNGVPVVDYAVNARNLSRQTHCHMESGRLLVKTEPDVILCIDSTIASLISLKTMADQLGLPCITSVHGLSKRWQTDYKGFIEDARRCFAAAAAVIFASRYQTEYFQNNIGALRKPPLLIRNFCADVFFRPRNEDLRYRLRTLLNVPVDSLLCLSAARVEPEKGQIVLLKALSLLRKKNAGAGDIHVAIAGSGSAAYMNVIQRAIGQEHLDTQVSLLGPRNDIPDLLDASDCFVLLSGEEGAPLSIIEAMTKGVPIVATRVGDIPEMVDESCAVLLPFQPNEPDQNAVRLADVLSNLRADRAKLTQMGSHAHARARSLFSAQRTAGQYAAVIGDVVQAHSARKRPFLTPQIQPCQPKILYFDEVGVWNLLGEGWSEGERRGIWTDGPDSTMNLDLGQTTHAVRLRFRVKPFIDKRCPHQQTDIYANGTKVGSWMSEKPGRQYLDVTVPAEILKTSCGRVELHFAHHSPCSPAATGSADDGRLLSFFFIFLVVQSVSANMANTLADRVGGAYMCVRPEIRCAAAETRYLCLAFWRSVMARVSNRYRKLAAVSLAGAVGSLPSLLDPRFPG